MLTDKNLISEKPHSSSFAGGVQRIYRFKDGHGLSVVNGPALHSYSFAWEAAVIEKVSEDGENFKLTYDTELTDDVEIFQSDAEANLFIEKAEKLFNK